jgi:type I restriction enzyme, R subunit
VGMTDGASDRQTYAGSIPDDIQRLLAELVATSTQAGDVVGIYAAVGMARPSLADLGPGFVHRAQQAANPHLAIEALLTEEATRATRNNVIRRRAFSERLPS